MADHRVFYVKQGSLLVSQTNKGDQVSIVEFTDDAAGHNSFDAYLAKNPAPTSVMLIDVIEEEFTLESIPKLGARDRKVLIENRSQRKFQRTPYRASVLHGKSEGQTGEYSVTYSAITNHELVDPWIRSILHHKTPLSGLHSVPMLAPKVFSKMFAVSGAAMFIAPHQETKLRQVFLRNGKVHSARLSQSPAAAGEEFARFVVTESVRSRRYLERNRLLGGMENLNICVVADDETAARISALSESDESSEFEFIDPVIAAQKLGLPTIPTAGHFEEAYISIASQRRPKHSYALSGENRYWKMQGIRSFLIAAAVSTAAVCSVLAAVFFSDTLILKSRTSEIQLQVEHLSETFRRENEKFDPIKADSHEMKLAVDTGDFILANRLPVPWVMNQLSAVLGDYPDIQVSELHWLAEAAPIESPPRRPRSDVATPVAVQPLQSVSAELTAHIVDFDGDMRRAFARIDELVADFAARTNFSGATAIEYPFDASTSSAISGEIIRQHGTEIAQFRVRVVYELPNSANNRQGGSSEST